MSLLISITSHTGYTTNDTSLGKLISGLHVTEIQDGAGVPVVKGEKISESFTFYWPVYPGHRDNLDDAMAVDCV